MARESININAFYKKVDYRLILFVLPIFLWLLLSYNRNQLQYASFKTVDPEYIHLVSSISLANGDFVLRSIENPASTLYIFGAVILKGIYLISGDEKNILEDFLLNPEKYISYLRIAISFVLCFSMLIMGLRIWKATNNILTSIFFQSISFFSFEIIHSETIICPESFIIIVMFFLIPLLINLESKEEFRNNEIVYLSLLSSLGIATKLTFFPILVLLLIIIPNTYSKLKYLFFLLLFTLIFAFPVLIQYELFITWIKGLVTHTGVYGSGDPGFANPLIFFENIFKIIVNEKIFSIVTFILGYVSISSLFKKNIKSNIMIIGLFIAFVLQIIFTSKQYALRYLMPSLLLSFYALFYLIKYYKEVLFKINSLIRNVLTIIFILIFISVGTSQNYLYNKRYKNHNISRMSICNKLSNIKEPIIIMPNYFGSASTIYPLNFSSNWTGIYKDKYFKLLNEFYPNVYFYFAETNSFEYWGQKTSLYNIISNNPNLFVYASLDATQNNEDDYYDSIVKMFTKYNMNNNLIEISTIEKENYDALFQLSTDTNKFRNSFKVEEIYFDSSTFNLNNDNQFGTTVNIDSVEFGEYYELNILKKSDDNNCFLVASCENNISLYYPINNVTETIDSWDRISLNLEITKRLKGKSVSFYVWYNGENQVLVKDLKLIKGVIE